MSFLVGLRGEKMAKFEPGSWVWIEDEEERYLPAKVLSGFSVGQATTVRTEDGEDHKLDAAASSKVVECNVEVLSSNIDDLINISDLNEMSILHSLRIRFKEDKIYTAISAILISVNPFRLLPLYTLRFSLSTVTILATCRLTFFNLLIMLIMI